MIHKLYDKTSSLLTRHLWRISTAGCGTGRVSTAKSGRDPDWAVPTRLTVAYYSFEVLRAWKRPGKLS